ncbi:hypothetical protein Ancab_011440 [Ancistrocladus abbreviatus]
MNSTPILSVLFHTIFLLFFNVSSSNHIPTTRHGNETDRAALLLFKSEISEEYQGVLASWNSSLHFCQWIGVICGRKHQRVVGLHLEGQSLAGLISPHIGNLSFLRSLNLANNSLEGGIPAEVGYLRRLRSLNISYNSLKGDIPVSLSNCSNLVSLSMDHNHLHGGIPFELGSLSRLITFSIGENNLTGIIPSSIGNLSSIQQLLLNHNQLEGELPDTISQLSSIKQLGLGANNLHGSFPPSIYNLSSLEVISLAYNNFHGNLRLDTGLILPKLQAMLLSSNNFTGPIPASLSNASSLSDIDFSTNNFVGNVPTSLGYLQELSYLNLEENFLGSTESLDLGFITSLTNCSNLQLLSFESNRIEGQLPNSITNLSTQLTWLGFGSNYIWGSIPADISKLSNLYVLSMENNSLMASIPASIGELSSLQVLSLATNNLTGQIPSSLGNISDLSWLLLNENKLGGSIVSSFSSRQNLQILDLSVNEFNGPIPKQLLTQSSLNQIDLSHNHFSGPLPPEVGKLTGLNKLYLSDNKLSAEIPNTLGSCLSLEELHLQNNILQGSIPSLGELKGLQYLDLSRNKLSGQIPSYMVKLPSLQYLNLSFNDLEGAVPVQGIFGNASAIEVYGNSKLCGGIQELHLQPCPAQKQEKKNKHIGIKYIMVIVICSLLLPLILFVSLLSCKRVKRKPHPVSSFRHFYPKISYRELFNATGGFSPDNLIGSGTFGIVYKGILGPEETTIAVKVLKLQKKDALKSFLTECKALGNLRHRNLVKLLTVCSSADYQGNEFKALVYQFMPNGNLDTWLHPEDGQEQSRHLNLLQRLNIAIDVASALHYLHEGCQTPVVHRDLKPSNVLLDNDLVAHVSDFGLAKLLLESGNGTEVSQFSSSGFKGTIGYAAPEYGTGFDVSTYGDVYSFGILLLEILTGKRPTDEQFKEDLNLHNYVKMALPMRILEIVDYSLVYNEGNLEVGIQDSSDERSKWTECITSVFQVGLACSEEPLRNRMKMEEVTSKLVSIRDQFLQAGMHQKARAMGDFPVLMT